MALTDLQSQLQSRLLEISLTHAQTRSMERELSDELFSNSRFISGPDFSQIHNDDLQRVFEYYDHVLFDDLCSRLANSGRRQLLFRLSRRMTSNAGRTTMEYSPAMTRGDTTRFEIAVSTTLLFQTFDGNSRNVTVCGRDCRSRLDGLLRIVEHEMVHLAEMLVWNDSSCARARFRGIVSRLFHHAESSHQLLTPAENAHDRFGISVGDRVRFSYRGETLDGFVNRLTHRASILVPDAQGHLYQDGARYVIYYVPASLLDRLGD